MLSLKSITSSFVLLKLRERLFTWHHAVSMQRIQEGSEAAPLWGPRVEDQCRGRNVAYLHHLGVACHVVQDPVA